MADEYSLEAVVRFGVLNDKVVDSAIEKAKKQLSELEKEADLSADAVNRVSKAFKSIGEGQKNSAARDLAKDLTGVTAAEQKATQATQRASQAVRDNAAELRGEAAARKSTLAALKADILGRHEADQANQQFLDNLPRLRYALYDVSTTATVAGAAISGLGIATAATSITMARSFADVERTSGATGLQLKNLRDDFDELFRTIPVGFSDLTNIGSIGGQLNIAASNLAGFTEAVAKFSATSNVTVEATATAFGRLDQLLPDVQGNYIGLSDAILKVGVNSVATEDQIIAISSQLAGVATTAKLSSNELIALSGTLASLGTAPELSRGTITRLFANIEQSIVGGGDRLESFASLSGRTSAQFRADWGNDSYSVIVDLFRGIGETGGDAGNALRQLGITASRDIPVFQKLAQNAGMLEEYVALAGDSAGETAKQYDILASTVSEKINVLINNFQSLIDTAGNSANAMGGVVDVLILIVDTLRRVVDTPAGATFAALALVVAGVVGPALLLFGAMARLAGSMAAVATAKSQLNIQSVGLIGTYKALTAAMTENSVAAGVNAGATSKLTGALGALGRAGGYATLAIAGIAVAQTAYGYISDLTLAVEGNAKSQQEWADIVGESGTKLEELARKSSNSDFWTQDNNLAQAGGDLDNFLGFLDQLAAGGYATKLQGEWLEIDSALATFAQSGNATQVQEQLDNLRRIMVDEGSWSTEAFDSTFSGVIAALDGGKLAASQATEEFAGLADTVNQMVKDFLDVESSALNLQDSIYSLGQSLGENGNAFDQFSEAGRANMGALLDTIEAVAAQTPGDAAATAANLQALYDTLISGAGVSANSLIFLSQTIAGLRAAAGGQTAAATVDFSNLSRGVSTGMKRVSGGAKKAAKEVRTLLDYANDLQSVFGRAFDIRFKAGLQMDEVADSWETLNKRIRDAQIELQKFTADREVKEYFLSVAVEFGDDLRAGVLRGEIAELNEKIAETQAESSTELVGNTKAARANQKIITDLVSGYQDYITSLAESGADQATLNAAVARSQAEFTAQAQALGFSNAQLQPYIASFRDMTVAINQVPRNITVAANVDPAIQALNELVAKAASAGAAAGGGFRSGFDAAAAGVGASLGNQIDNALRNKTIRIQGGTGTLRFNSSGQLIEGNLGSMRFFSGGGYTGAGGKYDPAGIVHKGEYVVPKHQVDQRTGLPYASALGQLQRGTTGRSGYAGGGHATGDAFVVAELSAQSMRQLNRPIQLVVDGRVLANVVYNNNERQSLRSAG